MSTVGKVTFDYTFRSELFKEPQFSTLEEAYEYLYHALSSHYMAAFKHEEYGVLFNRDTDYPDFVAYHSWRQLVEVEFMDDLISYLEKGEYDYLVDFYDTEDLVRTSQALVLMNCDYDYDILTLSAERFELEALVLEKD